MARERNTMLNGLTDLLVFKILDLQESYVYEATNMIHNLSEELLDVHQSTVYTVMYKLARQGYLSVSREIIEEGRSRVYYVMAAKGRERLKKLLENYDQTITGVNNVIKNIDKMKKERGVV